MPDQPVCCDFCYNSNLSLYEGGFDPLVHICASCATKALSEITPRLTPEPAPLPDRPSKEETLASIPSPKTLVTILDQHVIGQTIAKRRLALGVTNHFQRLIDAWDRNSSDPIVADSDLRQVVVEKSNILLIGPSGSGKTHLVKSLASFLNVPLAIGDATSLTEAGYIGEDVESLLLKLIQAAGGDIDAAQRGIVYIDEIDKIRAGGSGYKDMRLGVQHALLKILEGVVATVPPGGYTHPQQPGIPFDTTNVLFICGGSFVGLEDIVARRLGHGAFGFDQSAPARHDEAAHPLHQVLPEDLEKFGLITELLGRLPVIATLDDLGVDDLVRILREPRNSLIGQYRKLLKYRNADVIFTDGAIREIARIAHERGTGARGLRAVVERVMEGILFDPQPWATYRITEATVRGGQPEFDKYAVANPAPLRSRVARRPAAGGIA